MAGDQHWYSKVLGLHMDGTNGSTTFTDVKGKTVTAYGNAQISTAQYPALTGKTSSGYFDGTGDYLELSDTSDFDFGTGDFLVRFRCRISSYSGTFRLIIHRGQASGYTPWAMYISTTGELYCPISVTGSSWACELYSTTTLSVDTWYALELYRYGTEIGIRVNGEREDYATVSGALMVSTSSPRIGVNSIGANAYEGYLSEIEIYKGTGVNTANYTPATVPFADEYVSVSGTTKDYTGTLASRLVRVYRQDSGAFVGQQLSNASTGVFKITAANTRSHVVKHSAVCYALSDARYARVLALHMDGANNSTAFTDEEGWDIPAYGNAKISTAQYPALTGKSSSAYFDGTGDYLLIPYHNRFNFAGNNFTIRFLVRFSYVPGAGDVVVFYTHRTNPTNNASLIFLYGGTNKWEVDFSTSGTSSISAANLNTTVPSIDTWYDVELTRDGPNLDVYIDGTKGTTYDIGTNVLYNSTADISIFCTDATNLYGYSLNGYASEYEVYNGEAIHTANFTPSSDPFPNPPTTTENALIYADITPN